MATRSSAHASTLDCLTCAYNAANPSRSFAHPIAWKGVARTRPLLSARREQAQFVYGLVLREKVSSRNSLDISNSMPVLPTEKNSTLSRGHMQGRRRL